MKQLIVTADDFGLTRSVDEGIAMALKEGIVSFVNLLPTGDAYENSLDALNGLGVKELGAHLALTETQPVTDPAKIPSLVTKDGRFFKHHTDLFIRLFSDKIKIDHIHLELRNQLERVKKAKLPITNISSHEHIHMMPKLLEVFVELAKEYDIPSIRCPRREISKQAFSFKRIYKSVLMAYFEKGMKPIMDRSGLIYANHFLGFLDSGALNEDRLVKMLESLEEGVTELVTHPGFLGPEIIDRYRFHKNCEYELSALTSPRVKKIVEEKKIALTTFGRVAS